jgi:hypothetical protein
MILIKFGNKYINPDNILWITITTSQMGWDEAHIQFSADGQLRINQYNDPEAWIRMISLLKDGVKNGK